MGSCLSQPDLRAAADSPQLTDEEALSMIYSFDFSGKRLGRNHDEHFPAQVWRISPDTALKKTDSACETYTMMVVALSTSIPVPKVRKCVLKDSNVWTFMEYIEGPTLEEAWSTLSIPKKIWVAWTIRSYILQLRRLTQSLPAPHVPGPKDGTEHPRRCEGHYFTEIGAGPFSSYYELCTWFSEKADVAVYLDLEYSKYHGKPPSLSRGRLHSDFDNTAPLVLTHGDISLRNLILGKDGRLWLIDWGNSGVYPQWLEYASMMAYSYKHGPTPRLWLWLIPFMAGWYRPQFLFVRALGHALIYYA